MSSTVIDDKIVSLQFDNKNFEKNVSKTMGTLDKLKQKLNFSGAEKSLQTLEKASSEMTFNKMEKSLSFLEKRFQAFGISSMRVIENVTDSMMRFATKPVKFITENINAAGKQRAMNVQQANFQLKGMLDNSKELDAILDQARESVNDTAYRFDSAALAASQFAASGLRAGELMNKGLRGITGVAAMTNSQYEDISRIFTQVSGQGRLLGQDLLQLSSRGLNAAATIADYLTKIGDGTKVTEAEVRQMVSRGKIDFEIFASAMSDAFGSHAKKANETVNGVFSNVKAALSKIGELFYEDIVANDGPLVHMLDELRIKLNVIKDAVKPLVKFASGAVIKVINKIASAIKSIDIDKLLNTNGWDKLSKRISNAGVDISKFQNALISTAKKHGINVDALIEKYGDFNKSLKDGWVTGKLVAETLRGMSGTSATASKNQEDLNKKLEYFQDVVDRVWQGEFKNAPERYQLLAEAGYDWAKVQDLVNKTTDHHRLTLKDLNETQLEAVGYTKQEIKVIKELAKEAEKTGSDLNDLINDLSNMSVIDLVVDSFTNISNMFSTLGKTASDAWKEMFPKNNENEGLSKLTIIAKHVHDFTKKLSISEETASKLKRVFKGIIAEFKIFARLIKTIGGVGLKVLNLALSTLGKLTGKVSSSWLDFAANIADSIVSIDKWIEKNNVLQIALSKLKEGFFKLSNIIETLFHKVSNLPEVVSAVEKIRSGFKNFCDTVYENFGPAIDAIANLINTIKSFNYLDFKAIAQGLRSIWEAVKQSFSDHKGEYLEIGKNIFIGLVNGIKETIGTVIDTVVELATKVIEKVKDVLGIHSPSTVFMEIGENIVEGLAIGIQNGLPILGQIMQGLGDFLIRSLKIIDLTDIFAIGGFIAVMHMANKLVKSITALSNSVTGFGSVTKSIVNTIDSISKMINRTVNRYIDAKAMEARAEAFKAMALSIVEIAGALAVLSLIPTDKLWAGVGALTAVMGALVVMVKTMGSAKDIPNLTAFAVMIVSVGIAFKLMNSTFKTLGDMQVEQWTQAIAGMIAMIGMFTLMGATLNKLNQNPVEGARLKSLAISFIGVAIAIKMLTKSLSIIGNMDIGTLLKSGGVIVILLGTLSKISNKLSAVKGINANLTGLATLIIKLAASFAIMGVAFKIIGSLSIGDIIKSIVVLTYVGSFMAAAVLALSMIKGVSFDFSSAGNMFLKLATSMILLGAGIRIIASLSPSEVNRASIVLVQIGAFMTVLTFVAGQMGGDISIGKFKLQHNFSNIGTMFLKIGAAFIAIGAGIRIIAGIKPQEMNKAMTVLRRLSLFATQLIAVSFLAGEHADKAGDMLMKISVVLGVFAVIVRLLRGLSEDDINKGLIFINGCTAFFSSLLFFSYFVGEHADKAANMLAKLTLPIAALAASIIVLSTIDTDKLTASAQALFNTLIGLTALMAAAGHAKVDFKSMVTMLGAIGILTAVLAMLSKIDADASIQNAVALSTILLALSASMRILKNVDPIDIKALGSIAILGAIVAALGAALGVMNKYDWTASIEQAVSLSILLGALVASTVVLGSFGSIGPAAVEGALAMAAIIAIITTTIGTIGLAVQQWGALDEIKTGVDTLVTVMTGIGDAIGGFIGGTLSFIPEIVGEIGVALESFKNIDPNAGSTIKNVAEGLGELVKSNILNNIAKVFGAGAKKEDMVNGFTMLGEAVGAFANSTSNLDESAVEKAKNVSKILVPIAELEKQMPSEGGIWQKIAGFKNVEGFATGIKSLGENLKSFVESIPENLASENIQAKVNSAIDALNGLVGIASTIPDTSGKWLTNFIIFNDADRFSKSIASMGESLSVFVASIPNNLANDDINAKVENSIKALEGLVKVADKIPDSSGEFLSKFVVFNDTGLFATGIANMGTALGDFVTNIPDLSNDDSYEKVKQAIKVLKSLVEFSNSIPEEGFIDKILNMGDLSGFASQLERLGTGLSKFATKSNEIGDLSNATKAAETLKVLINGLKGLSEFKASGVSEFVNAINALSGAKVKGFISNFGNGASEQLAKIGSEMAGSLAKGVKSKSEALATALNSLVMSAAKSVKTAPMTDAGKKIGKAFVDAVANKKSSAKTAGENLNKSAAEGASYSTTEFYNAGASCVEGFVNGISENSFKASAQASAMASAAATAARAALDVNSPSKVFRRIGYCVPEGFAQGIDRMTYMVTDSVDSMSNAAILNGESALSAISLFSNSDIQPTIRPVVDLSNVEHSARELNNMLSGNPMSAVYSAQSINSAMSNKHNPNADVISSINELKKALSSVPGGNNYNINGITYDDGSNVSNAVQELIRAAKIERRV